MKAKAARYERHGMKAKMAAYKIAAKIEAMDKADDIEVFGPKILALMKGVPYEVWIVLDEKPGLFGYMGDRFYMLRQVRNHPEFGRTMFAGLKK
jgi:hypothetical protein